MDQPPDTTQRRDGCQKPALGACLASLVVNGLRHRLVALPISAGMLVRPVGTFEPARDDAFDQELFEWRWCSASQFTSQPLQLLPHGQPRRRIGAHRLQPRPFGNERQIAQVIGELLLELHRQEHTILIVVTHSAELARNFPQQMEMADGSLVISH